MLVAKHWLELVLILVLVLTVRLYTSLAWEDLQVHNCPGAGSGATDQWELTFPRPSQTAVSLLIFGVVKVCVTFLNVWVVQTVDDPLTHVYKDLRAAITTGSELSISLSSLSVYRLPQQRKQIGILKNSWPVFFSGKVFSVVFSVSVNIFDSVLYCWKHFGHSGCICSRRVNNALVSF